MKSLSKYTSAEPSGCRSGILMRLAATCTTLEEGGGQCLRHVHVDAKRASTTGSLGTLRASRLLGIEPYRLIQPSCENIKGKQSLNQINRWAVGKVFNLLCYIAALVICHLTSPFLTYYDSSSELILAKMLLDGGGGVLSDRWLYSTELRVLNTQLVYEIGLFLFPNNWHAARTFSVAIFLLIVYLCYRYLLKTLCLWDDFSWTAGLLFLPFSFTYKTYFLYFSYYIPHVCISFSAVALFLNAESAEQYRKLHIAAGCFLAFVSGLGGVRYILLCYLPLLLSVFLNVFPGSYHKVSETAITHVLMLLCACGIGYLLNAKVLSEYYSVYNYMELSPSNTISISTLVDLAFSGFLATWGYAGASNLTGASGIYFVAQLVTIASLMVSIVICIQRKEDLSNNCFIVLSFFIIGILLNSFASLVMGQQDTLRYLSPSSLFALPVFATSLDVLTKTDRGRHFCVAGGILFAGGILLMSLFITKDDVKMTQQPTAYQEIATYVLDHGYERGITTFWYGNALTELTNGSVEIWHYEPGIWDSEVSSTPEFFAWLQSANHLDTPPRGRVFLVVTDDELTSPGLASLDSMPDYETGPFNIFLFDSYEDYVSSAYSIPSTE